MYILTCLDVRLREDSVRSWRTCEQKFWLIVSSSNLFASWGTVKLESFLSFIFSDILFEDLAIQFEAPDPPKRPILSLPIWKSNIAAQHTAPLSEFCGKTTFRLGRHLPVNSIFIAFRCGSSRTAHNHQVLWFASMHHYIFRCVFWIWTRGNQRQKISGGESAVKTLCAERRMPAASYES